MDGIYCDACGAKLDEDPTLLPISGYRAPVRLAGGWSGRCRGCRATDACRSVGIGLAAAVLMRRTAGNGPVGTTTSSR
jgi:hypothetical protein